MKIALLGYGKMGKMIEGIALDRGHSIVAKIDVNEGELNVKEADIAIDFSTPDAAFNNITHCFKNNVAVISGTTGWLDKYEEAVKICNENKSAFIYGSNFSLGVNLFFELNSHLAKLMKGLDQYQVSMEEIHHVHKLDAPSGTAISLAEDIISDSNHSKWSLDGADEKAIAITSKREGEVPGTHTVDYNSSVDLIQIKHLAHNRQGFALGAVIAAEWLHGKTGVFSMKDVLNLK